MIKDAKMDTTAETNAQNVTTHIDRHNRHSADLEWSYVSLVKKKNHKTKLRNEGPASLLENTSCSQAVLVLEALNVTKKWWNLKIIKIFRTGVSQQKSQFEVKLWGRSVFPRDSLINRTYLALNWNQFCLISIFVSRWKVVFLESLPSAIKRVVICLVWSLYFVSNHIRSLSTFSWCF